MLGGIWRDRMLIQTLVRRDVLGRYRGSVMGILWSFFHPFLMLGVFTFVFSVVLKTRWRAGGDSPFEFALVLFAGMLVFNLFAECIGRAPGLVLNNVNYVKKVVFPLEVLALVSLASAFLHMCVGLAMWVVFHFLLVGAPAVTVLLAPFALLPIALLTLGLSWILASLGVFLRDVAHVVGVVTTGLMFLSPLFYPLSSFPDQYRFFVVLNPVTRAINDMRDVLVWGSIPDLPGYFAYAAISALVAWLGFAWFQKTRRGFADVL